MIENYNINLISLIYNKNSVNNIFEKKKKLKCNCLCKMHISIVMVMVMKILKNSESVISINLWKN